MLKFDSEYSKCLIKNDKIMGLCHIKRKKNPASEPVMVNIRVFHSLPFFQLFYIQVFFQLLKYKEKVGEKVGTIQKKKAQKFTTYFSPTSHSTFFTQIDTNKHSMLQPCMIMVDSNHPVPSSPPQ